MRCVKSEANLITTTIEPIHDFSSLAIRISIRIGKTYSEAVSSSHEANCPCNILLSIDNFDHRCREKKQYTPGADPGHS